MKILVFNWRDIDHPKAGGSEVNLDYQSKYWARAGHQVTIFSAKYPGSKNRVEPAAEIELPEDRIKARQAKEKNHGANQTAKSYSDQKEAPAFQNKSSKKSTFSSKGKNSAGCRRFIYRGGQYTVYLWAPIYYLLGLNRFAEVVVDIQNGIPFFTPLFCRRKIVGIIYHICDQQFFQELKFPLNFIGFWIESKLAPRLYRHQKMITISKSTQAEMIKLGYPAKNIDIVYCGVDHSIYYPDGEKTPFPSVVYVGRFKKYKRLHLLVEAFAEVVKKVPNARLYFAGRGETEPEIKRLVKELGLEKSVEFLGFIDDNEKRRLLSESWIFATPSSREGWGLSIVEANACGTPSVAFNVSGIQEVIKTNHSGILSNSTSDFFYTLPNLLCNNHIIQNLSRNAAIRANNYRWKDISSIFFFQNKIF